MTAAATTSPPVVGTDYRLDGPADGPHSVLVVKVPAAAGGNQVKGIVAAALKAQCGYDHYLTARRRNTKGLSLRWKIGARCAVKRVFDRAEVDGLPGVDGMLRPVDDDVTERAEQALVAAAANAAAEFYAGEYARRNDTGPDNPGSANGRETTNDE